MTTEPRAEAMTSELDRLRAEHVAAWSRDVALGDWPIVANTASSKYVPALEHEVDRLRSLVDESPLVRQQRQRKKAS